MVMRRVNWRGGIFVVALLIALEGATRWVVDSKYIPVVSDVLVALGKLISSGDLFSAAASSLRVGAIGFAAAIVAGTLFGVVLGAWPRAFEFSKLVIEFLRPLPSVAVIPLLILLLGVGDDATIVMVTYGALWPILFNTYHGVRDADVVAIDSARACGLGRGAVIRRVMVPLAATSIATGVRISAALALILTITVEMLTNSGGLGYQIVRMQEAIRIDEMYAWILAVGIIGYVINRLVVVAERRVIFWKSPVTNGGNDG